LYVSVIIRVVKSRRMRWAGHAARMGEMRNANTNLFGSRDVKRPLRRSWRRWEDNIRMEIGKEDGGDVDWIHMTQDRDQWWVVVNTIMNLRVP
jgi:hypothetical protein